MQFPRLLLLCVGATLSSSLHGDVLHLWSSPIFIAEPRKTATVRAQIAELAANYIKLTGIHIPSARGWKVQGMEVNGCLTPRTFAAGELAGAHFLALSAETETALVLLDPRGAGRPPFDRDFRHRLKPGQLLLYPSWLTVVSESTHCSRQRVTRYQVLKNS